MSYSEIFKGETITTSLVGLGLYVKHSKQNVLIHVGHVGFDSIPASLISKIYFYNEVSLNHSFSSPVSENEMLKKLWKIYTTWKVKYEVKLSAKKLAYLNGKLLRSIKYKSMNDIFCKRTLNNSCDELAPFYTIDFFYTSKKIENGYVFEENVKGTKIKVVTYIGSIQKLDGIFNLDDYEIVVEEETVVEEVEPEYQVMHAFEVEPEIVVEEETVVEEVEPEYQVMHAFEVEPEIVVEEETAVEATIEISVPKVLSIEAIEKDLNLEPSTIELSVPKVLSIEAIEKEVEEEMGLITYAEITLLENALYNEVKKYGIGEDVVTAFLSGHAHHIKMNRSLKILQEHSSVENIKTFVLYCNDNSSFKMCFPVSKRKNGIEKVRGFASGSVVYLGITHRNSRNFEEAKINAVKVIYDGQKNTQEYADLINSLKKAEDVMIKYDSYLPF
jgi:hypothetical protein